MFSTGPVRTWLSHAMYMKACNIKVQSQQSKNADNIYNP